jgi:hypothetical protein
MGAGVHVTVQFTPCDWGSPATSAAKLAIADNPRDVGGASVPLANEIAILLELPLLQLSDPSARQIPAINAIIELMLN